MTCNWLFNMICHEQNKHFAKEKNPKQGSFFKGKIYDLKCTGWIGLVNWAIHSQQPSFQCHWHYFKWRNLNWWKANVSLVFPEWYLNKWQFHSCMHWMTKVILITFFIRRMYDNGLLMSVSDSLRTLLKLEWIDPCWLGCFKSGVDDLF